MPLWLDGHIALRTARMPVHKQRFRRPEQAEAGLRLKPVFQDFHLLTMEGDFEYPRHQHTNYELILIEHGPYRCELNGAEIRITAPQALLIKPGDWHQDHLRDGQRHYVLHFELRSAVPGVAASPVFRDGVAPDDQVAGGDFSGEIQLVRELRQEAESRGRYSGAIQDALLEAIFWRTLRLLRDEALSPQFRQLPDTDRRREEIATVFTGFLGKNPTVTELAGALQVSPRQLVNQCRALFGQAPARLLLEMKLRRADELLRYRGMRVSEVSGELGFANPYHFSRVYKRLRGLPPNLSRQRSDPA
ncbi:MAG: AraC family transcriptional regulator [Opitutaceae bacterium]|nr:AraC family transcriptional regulator [Opitutaceae bacterium]